MKNDYPLTLVATFILILAITGGCAPKQVPSAPKDAKPACIQGTIQYRSPFDSTTAPYANVKVTAWRDDTDQALGEVLADRSGNYCIEVPLGESRVDLRIWGLVDFSGTHYICKSMRNDVELGTTSKKCGGGDCIKVDVMAECHEFYPKRRR